MSPSLVSLQSSSADPVPDWPELLRDLAASCRRVSLESSTRPDRVRRGLNLSWTPSVRSSAISPPCSPSSIPNWSIVTRWQLARDPHCCLYVQFDIVTTQKYLFSSAKISNFQKIFFVGVCCGCGDHTRRCLGGDCSCVCTSCLRDCLRETEQQNRFRVPPRRPPQTRQLQPRQAASASATFANVPNVANYPLLSNSWQIGWHIGSANPETSI